MGWSGKRVEGTIRRGDEPMIDVASLMAGLTFFRQARIDGGVRTGIMLGESTILHRFEEGGADNDPALVWFVDLRCNGSGLPVDAEGARRWLIEHEGIIRGGFTRFAGELQAGADVDSYPLQWEGFKGAPDGVQMKIVCGATRRVDALRLADVLNDVAARWRQMIEELSPAIAISL
jgi:hypothetical protein